MPLHPYQNIYVSAFEYRLSVVVYIERLALAGKKKKVKKNAQRRIVNGRTKMMKTKNMFKCNRFGLHAKANVCLTMNILHRFISSYASFDLYVHIFSLLRLEHFA